MLKSRYVLLIFIFFNIQPSYVQSYRLSISNFLKENKLKVGGSATLLFSLLFYAVFKNLYKQNSLDESEKKVNIKQKKAIEEIKLNLVQNNVRQEKKIML